jgi:hypothetical protein
MCLAYNITGSRAPVVRPCSRLRAGYAGYAGRGTGRLRGERCAADYGE